MSGPRKRQGARPWGVGQAAGLALACALVLSSCGGLPVAVPPSSTPTESAPPPSPTPAPPTSTPEPTATPEPSATSGPLTLRGRAGGLTCRFGPGAEYAPGGGVMAGVSALVSGRNVPGDWIAIQLPTHPQLRCWVRASEVELSGDLAQAPVLSAPLPYVSQVTVEMEPDHASIPCGTFPYTFSVTFSIEVTGPTVVTFRRMLSDGSVAPVESVEFAAYGVQTFEDSYRVGEPGAKWFRVQVLTPNPVTGEGTAQMDCTP